MKSLARGLMLLTVAPLSVAHASNGVGQPPNAFVNFGVPGVGGAANHMVVPDEITIAADGIVNFATVSGASAASGGGFHQVAVYQVAHTTTLKSIADQLVPGSSYDIFDGDHNLVLHVTAGASRVDSDPSDLRTFLEDAASATPRIVGVHFPEPGTYLVICNVRSHLDNGMIAIVTVK